MKYLSAVLCTILFLSCEAPKPVAETAETPVTRAPKTSKSEKTETSTWYSPFVLDVESQTLAFQSITFKDVGTKLESDDREPIMETLAEGLATALENDPAFQAQWNMRYDASLQKAESHLECEAHHLYVDLWDGDGRWGYSLWSGCSENDNFAKGQATIVKKDDPVDHVAPLVEAVRKELQEAHKTKCFEKSC